MTSLPALPSNKLLLVIILSTLIFGCAKPFNEVPWTLDPTTPDADGHVGPEKHQGLIHFGSDKDDKTKFGQTSSSLSKTFTCKGRTSPNTFCNIKLTYSFDKHGRPASGGHAAIPPADAGEKIKISVSSAGGSSKNYYITDQQLTNATETVSVECGVSCEKDVTVKVSMTKGATDHLQSHATFDITNAVCEETNQANSSGHLTNASGEPLPKPN